MTFRHQVAVNLPADGLFLAIINKAEGDFSRENCAGIVQAFLQRFLDADVDTVFLNVNYRRALTPSKVMDSYLYNIEKDETGKAVQILSPTTQGVSRYFTAFFTCARPLLEKGVDIYKIATDYLRKAGCKVYLSVRMNDGHYRDNPAINSRFAMSHSIAGDGADLDYTQIAVQDLFCDYIRELLENYHADGIELDWLRYPTVLPKEKRRDYTIINSYMHRIRELIDPKLSVAVRLYPEEEKNLAHGFDVAQWIADGTADLFTMENFYVPTNYEMPVAAWRESIAKRNTQNRPYTMLCGSDWGVCCKPGDHIPMNPALVRGFTRTCLERGADGVYLFNFFEENDDSSFEFSDGKLQNCFQERLKAAREPDKLPQRQVHIGGTAKRYPIVLHPGESYTWACGQQGFYRVLVGLDADVPLTANGVILESEPVYPGFDIQSGKGRPSEFVYALTQVAPYVKSAALTGDIIIQNNTSEPANILWLEIRI